MSVLLNEGLEDAAWFSPSSCMFKAFRALSLFTWIMARLLFLPLFKVFARAIECEEVHGSSQMVERPEVSCASLTYFTYAFPACLAAFTTTLLVVRLARVDYRLNAIEIKKWNPFDWSGDATVSKDRPTSHPYMSKSLMRDQLEIVVKAVFALASIFLTFDGRLVVMVFCSGQCVLAYADVVHKKFAFNRHLWLDPNAFQSAFDNALVYYFVLCCFVAAVSHEHVVKEKLDTIFFGASLLTPFVGMTSYCVALRYQVAVNH